MTVQPAQLSFTDIKAYYNLRVQPTYEEMLRSVKKEIRIPQPDRSAKFYALGPYRAFFYWSKPKDSETPSART